MKSPAAAAAAKSLQSYPTLCKSILLVSQIPVNAWYDIFSDHTYAEASRARVLNESYRLEMNGKNMRNFEPINKRKNG